MPPVTYSDFLGKYSDGKSTKKRAIGWDRLHNKGKLAASGRFGPPPKKAPTSPLAPAEPVQDLPVKWVPGQLSPDAIAQLGQFRTRLIQRTGKDEHGNPVTGTDGKPLSGEIDTQYQNLLARINQNRTRAGFNRNEGKRNVNSSHAARGTFRSGLQALDQGRVAADYEQIMNSLVHDENDATSARDMGHNEAVNEYALNANATRAAGALSPFQEFLAQTQDRTPPPPPPEPIPQVDTRAPTMKYEDFLKKYYGGVSNEKRARGWDRMHNFGRRFV